ncbi:MAG: UDP-N-acetylglucosamine 1-carboxyvinyltransferase [Acetobacteraceae bacterium]|nr:UDP-N-acetylglucosamine 1-carboxyvinyltransferase [Acetobacteraceae bacterium]
MVRATTGTLGEFEGLDPLVEPVPGRGWDVLAVWGGARLAGTIPVSAAKNAVLPILAASLLADGPTVLRGVPDLEDVRTMCRLLTELGCEVVWQPSRTLRIQNRGLQVHEAPYELVRLMRASFLVMGPLLARAGRAKTALPGGCAIGSRPIDLHLKGFAALGARMEFAHGRIQVEGRGLSGARIYLDFPSVTATENIMMAACLARGTTLIENAAQEPEVVDLAGYLNAAGGRVRGAGTDVVRVEGVDALTGCEYQVIPDRIEAGTFMLAAAMTGGNIRLENVVPEHLKAVVAKLREAGAEVAEESDTSLRVRGPIRPRAVDIKTLPFPGFPTDLQAPAMAMLTRAEGTSIVTETVFENRFLHVDELKRMGADIRIEGRSAIVRGVERLTGAPVRATDLRAGACLVLAGLMAEGITEITGVQHIDRGYADFVGKLQRVGARVERGTMA